MEERFVTLETKISYQEKTIAELNEVVTEQQEQLRDLERRLNTLEALVEQGTADDDPGNERPPHY